MKELWTEQAVLSHLTLTFDLATQSPYRNAHTIQDGSHSSLTDSYPQGKLGTCHE